MNDVVDDPLLTLEVEPNPETMALHLNPAPGDGTSQSVISNLSGVAAVGEKLFLVDDEGTSIRRLHRTGDGYRRDATFDAVSLFGHEFADAEGELDECDFEALSVEGGRLWVVGSHACGHGKLDPDKPKKMLGNLRRIKRAKNRLLFGCLPVGDDGTATPQTGSGRHMEIARAAGDAGGLATNPFLEALTTGDNAWFWPYTRLATKENGLDIEGLAVAGDRVWIGLRGPVIGERAVVIDLRVEESEHHIAPVAGSLRFHFLDLNGLGIRALLLDGADLLILAGMTMHRQGVAGLFRWTNAVQSSETDVVPAEDLAPVLRFDTTITGDVPEGMCFLPSPVAERGRLLVVRDRPRPGRIAGDAYLAEIYTLTR